MKRVDSPEELIRYLQKVRKSRGISTSELSLMTGIGRRGIYKIENGESDPKLSSILKIADALEVALGVADLLKGAQ